MKTLNYTGAGVFIETKEVKKIICDGKRSFVYNVKNEGEFITLSGWYEEYRYIPIGTELLISIDDGETFSPYKVVEEQNPAYPKDMFFLICKYNPTSEVAV